MLPPTKGGMPGAMDEMMGMGGESNLPPWLQKGVPPKPGSRPKPKAKAKVKPKVKPKAKPKVKPKPKASKKK